MTRERFVPQVEPSHYAGIRYDIKERFISYYNQIELIVTGEPEEVLEIGIGNGFVHRYLRQLGVSVHTVDADARLQPDTTASVLELPFTDESFDMVCCFETLEHLPWDSFLPALKELRRVARRTVLLSLPDVTPYFVVYLDRGKHHPKVLRFKELPNLRPREHVFDGEHYWEIGKRHYPVSRIEREIEQSGLSVVESSRSYDLPYHRYFRLRKA